jgi:hypothetical protein
MPQWSYESFRDSWTTSVAVLKVDVGGGQSTDLTAEQLAVCGSQYKPVTSAMLVPEPGVDEEGAPVPVTFEMIAAALAEMKTADAEAGAQAKVQAAEEAEAAAAEARAAAEAAGEPLPEAPSAAGPAEPPAPSTDVTYVLTGFTDTLANAEALLRSAVPLDAVIEVTLPEALQTPVPEEGYGEEEGVPAPVAVEGLLKFMSNCVAETLPPASPRNEITWASLQVQQTALDAPCSSSSGSARVADRPYKRLPRGGW